MTQAIQRLGGILLGLLLMSCSSTDLPEGLEPVEGFELERYLGKWYEIARLDHSFERGLEQVTAVYQKRQDGGISVLNRGYDPESERWEQAEGKAYFVEDDNLGRLKVSFFGPFYGGYNIIALDEQYRWSMVAGPDRSYLWILAREPALSKTTLERLVDKAEAQGFDTDALIYPQTGTSDEP